MRHKEGRQAREEQNLLDHFQSVMPKDWRRELGLANIHRHDSEDETVDRLCEPINHRLHQLVTGNNRSFFEALYHPRRPFTLIIIEDQPSQGQVTLVQREIVDDDTGLPKFVEELNLTYYSSQGNGQTPLREAHFYLSSNTGIPTNKAGHFYIKPVSESRFIPVISQSGRPHILEQSFRSINAEGVQYLTPQRDILYLQSDWYDPDLEARGLKDQFTFSPAKDKQPATIHYCHRGDSPGGYWYHSQETRYPHGGLLPLRHIRAANAYWGHQSTSQVEIFIEPSKRSQRIKTYYTDIRLDPEWGPTHHCAVFETMSARDASAIIDGGQDLLYPWASKTPADTSAKLLYVLQFSGNFTNLHVSSGDARHQEIKSNYHCGPHRFERDSYPHAIVTENNQAFFFDEDGILKAINQRS
jgi:hypothetical protein